MQKFIVGSSLILFFALAANAQPVFFTLDGSVDANGKASMLYLNGAYVNAKIPIDSTGHFHYEGKATKQGSTLVYTNHSYPNAIWVAEGATDLQLAEYNPPVDLNPTAFLKITAINGPDETNQYYFFNNYSQQLLDRFADLPKQERLDSFNTGMFKVLHSYVQAHPDARLSVYMIGSSKLMPSQKDTLVRLLNTQKYQDEIEFIQQSIAQAYMLQPGNTVDMFTMKQLDGRLFSLDTVSANYILLDFWSSDCGPCRAKHPALRHTYEMYKEKGFAIVEISLDRKKSRWKKAVEKDQLPWTQVSDLKGWDNALAKKYLINAIPYLILIDRQGTIVGNSDTIENLNETLDKLFTE